MTTLLKQTRKPATKKTTAKKTAAKKPIVEGVLLEENSVEAVSAKNEVVKAFRTELNLTQKALLELRELKKGLVIDVTTEEGFKEARKERTERNKILKDIARAAIDTKNLVDEDRGEAEVEVIDIFSSIVDPFEKEDLRQKDEKAKKERLEAERLEKIRAEISKISIFAENLEGKKSTELSEIIEAVDLIDMSLCFDELTQEAIKVKKDTLSILHDALICAMKDEEFEEKTERLNEQITAQKEAAELAEKKTNAQNRVGTLAMIPVKMIGQSSFKINQKITAVKRQEIMKDEFLDYYDHALAAKETVIGQLVEMYNNQLKMENLNSEPETDTKTTEDVTAAMHSEEETSTEEAFNNIDWSESTTNIEIDELFPQPSTQEDRAEKYNMPQDFVKFADKYSLSEDAIFELSFLLNAHYNVMS